MEKLCTVAEKDEGGRCNRALRHIVDLKALALVGRGLYLFHCRIQKLVEHTRGDAGARLVVDVHDLLKDVFEALSRFCGNEDPHRQEP